VILKSLDDRLVPRMAAGLRRLLDGLTPGGSGDADEPSGRGGVLGLLRDVPQLAALLAAVVFLAVAGAFLLARSGDDRVTGTAPAPSTTASSPPSVSATDVVLGPQVGTAVDAYLARAAARTAQLAVQDGSARSLALVSLTDYLTPQAAAGVLAGVDVRQVYLRAPAAGDLAEVLEVPTPSELIPTLREFYATTAAAKLEDAEEFHGLADSIEETSPEETAAKQAYVADAQRASAEAQAYAADCDCVFAAVVEGPASALAELADDPAVRGVEPADRSARLEALQVFPLWPEHIGVVPPPPVPGGPTIPGEEGQ
jgi:hypothetical protein